MRAPQRLPGTVLAFLLPAVATGCLSRVLPEPAPPPISYDFGPPPDTPPARLPARFRLDAVTAPSWLRSQNIYYRRLDERPAALLPYARNRWIAPPPELFAERLSYRLARAEPAAAAGSPAAVELELELMSFEHVYTAPNSAYVVARARASYDGGDGRSYERMFETRRPAAAAVEGATTELPRAADELLGDVLAWLRAPASAP